MISLFFSFFLFFFSSFSIFFQIPGNCTQDNFLNIGNAMPGNSNNTHSSSSSSSSSSNNNININNNNNHNGNNGKNGVNVNGNGNGNGINNNNSNHMNTKIDTNTRHDDHNHYENPSMKLNIASSNHLSALKVRYFTPLKITEIFENSYNEIYNIYQIHLFISILSLPFYEMLFLFCLYV